VLGAAIEEFQRAGTSSADINAIVEAAGVSRSTFYFHFPTKEHVLLELIRGDEDRLAEELSRFLDTPHDLPAVLNEIIRLVLALEKQWGLSLFRDVTSLYFSPTLPQEENWLQHPTFVLLAAEIERSRHRGELYDDVDAYSSAAFFLVGLYALLTTNRESNAERLEVLRKFVKSSLRSMQRAAVPADYPLPT
jgi:AcrR family transcriptional regulator